MRNHRTFGEVDELAVAGHPFVGVVFRRGGDGFDEADEGLGLGLRVGAVGEELAAGVAQVGVLVVGVHEHRAIVLR